MQQSSGHQCLIYSGSPARHLLALAALIRQKLGEGYRCLYLDSPPMVAGMRSYLAAAGEGIRRLESPDAAAVPVVLTSAST